MVWRASNISNKTVGRENRELGVEQRQKTNAADGKLNKRHRQGQKTDGDENEGAQINANHPHPTSLEA